MKCLHWLAVMHTDIDMTASDSTGNNFVLTNADINGDNVVNFSDYLLLQTQYKKTPGTPTADLNGDGAVNFSDYLILQANYKKIGDVLLGEMIYIPAGDFLMGNNGSEPYSGSTELPQHSVTLPGYYIGKHEVTRREYRAFMAATGRTAPAYWTQAWGSSNFIQTENHPVVGVTWYDAEAYCAWAGGHLPSEAQWEKAARWTGSYPNVYPWGNTWSVENCNNSKDTNSAGGGRYGSGTAPVGSYPSGASPYGCQDMAGNVLEWCQDWYKSYPGSTSPFDYTNTGHVLRGGEFGSNDNENRCAYRYSDIYYDPYNFFYRLGFRLAR